MCDASFYNFIAEATADKWQTEQVWCSLKIANRAVFYSRFVDLRSQDTGHTAKNTIFLHKILFSVGVYFKPSKPTHAHFLLPREIKASPRLNLALPQKYYLANSTAMIKWM